jgi:hypothetical protein
MLSKAQRAVESPELAKTVLRSHLQAVTHLVSNGYPLEAILHIISISGLDLLVPYQKLKADEDNVLDREILDSKISLDLNDEGISTILARWGSREEEAVEGLKTELKRLRGESDSSITVLECGANSDTMRLLKHRFSANKQKSTRLNLTPET